MGPMCGIAGIAGEGAGSLAHQVERAVFAIRARGPDAQGFHVEPRVSLGHARLKIIDLSPRAAQPMANEARTVWLVFNGEIYNFAELRTRLEKNGHLFVSNSDTEVIVHGYEEYGEGVVDVLDGMFAFAIWDAGAARLVLARDRPGKKPLFHALHEGRLYFGSEPKALFAMGVPRLPDEGSFPHLLVSGYVPAPSTLYAKISELPPASILTWSPGDREPRVRRYWTLEFSAKASAPVEESKREIRTRLEQAVKRRLISDVPLGAFLSGGLDSTVVVGLMQRMSSRPVRTFSLGFEGDPGYDETPFAELAARSFGTEHTTFRVTPNALELLPELIHIHDGPFGDSSAIPTYLIAKLARGDVTVALTGDGGDELFCGYTRFARGALVERIPEGVRRLLGKAARRLPQGLDVDHPAGRARRAFLSCERRLGERILHWNSFFPTNDGLLPRNGSGDGLESGRAFHLRWYGDGSGTALDRMLKHNFEGYLPCDLLPKMDRMSMAHGLEVRSPLLDTELMEYAASLPDGFRLRRGTTKWIFREAFRDVLPRAIRMRGKMGFGLPLGTWFRTSLRDYVCDHLVADGARLHGHLNRGAVRRLVADHLERRGAHEHRIWLLLTFEIWLRTAGSLQPSATSAEA